VDCDFGPELYLPVLVVVERYGAAEFGAVWIVAEVVACSTKGWKEDAFHLPKRSSFEVQQ